MMVWCMPVVITRTTLESVFAFVNEDDLITLSDVGVAAIVLIC